MSESPFWSKLRRLVSEGSVVIDRPRDSEHPRLPGVVYPYDYGYLKGTGSSDGAELDVWIGSLDAKHLTAVICTVDLGKRDVELKLLLGCTPDERARILAFHNAGTQGGLLIETPDADPALG